MATDVSLQQLTTFLRQLKLSTNGFAFIVEPDGNLIAASRGPYLRQDNQRLNGAGLDWVIAVAVPRSDFLSGITANIKRTAGLAVLTALLIVATGFAVLGVVTRELRKLAEVTRDVGNGVLNTPLMINRKDELGDLAKSFSTMQKRLLTDRLTGLANREALTRRVEETIVRRGCTGYAHLWALLFVDLNRFKNVNDTFGHDAGDHVLQVLGARMVASLRADDLVARYAGDEFIILLDAMDKKETVERVRQKLEAKLAEPIEIVEGSVTHQVVTGAAIGVAFYPEDGLDMDTLVNHADANMYRRKAPWDGF